jgi:hypothetical protein
MINGFMTRSYTRRPLLLALFDTALGCRFEPQLPIPPHEIVWAIQVGLGPLLQCSLEQTPGLVPEAVAARVRAADRLARVASAERLEAAAEILDRCADRAGPVTLLKGISICTEHYARPHDRAMGDIDLLVAPEEVPAFESALGELGYEPTAEEAGLDFARHHHARPRLHPRTGVCVEVHRGLLPVGWVETGPFCEASVRAEKRPGELDGRPVQRLSPELQLVYIATHAALVFHPAAGARALLDTLLLLHRAPEALASERLWGWLGDRRIAARLQLLTTSLERAGLAPAHTGFARIRPRLAALGGVELRILMRLIELYQLRGLPLEDWLGADNRAVVWHALLATPGSAWNLARVPWNLMFPPSHPDRFRPRHQLARLRSALFRKS